MSPLPELVQSCHPPGRAPGSRSSVSPGSHPREAQEPATVTPLPLAPRPCNISVSLLSNSASYQVFNLPLQVVYIVRQEVGLRPFRSLDTANRAHAKSTHCARFHRLLLPNWSLVQPKRATEIVCLTAQYEVVKNVLILPLGTFERHGVAVGAVGAADCGQLVGRWITRRPLDSGVRKLGRMRPQDRGGRGGRGKRDRVVQHPAAEEQQQPLCPCR